MRFRKRAALVLSIALLVPACGIASGDESTVVADFTDAGDLVAGSQVQIDDVEVGRVDDIELVLEDGQMLARVTMSVDEDVDVPATSMSAVVRQTSLLGEQFVQLVPDYEASGPRLGETEVAIPVERTEKRVDVETFLGDLSALIGEGGLTELNRFTHAQALILEGRGERFGQVITELRKFTDVLAARRLDVGEAVDHLASASRTVADNQATLDSFLDSLDDANALLAEQSDQLAELFDALSRFGAVNARFLARHEEAITRQIRALRPVFSGVAGASDELRSDLAKLNTFLALFSQSFGGGPGGSGNGDYIQVEAILCEALSECHTRGEKGDVPGEGS